MLESSERERERGRITKMEAKLTKREWRNQAEVVIDSSLDNLTK